MSDNPYKSDTKLDQTEHPRDFNLPVTSSRQMAKASTTRKLLGLAACTVFLYFGYWFIREMADWHWRHAAACVTCSLTALPWTSCRAKLQDCLVATLVIVFGTAGGIANAVGYFRMFECEWFRAIFNDKGAGPLGLFLSVAVGFALGAFIGWLLVSRTPLLSRR
jgi:hypothetical protein